MTDNEIIKALWCCSKADCDNFYSDICPQCPYKNERYCAAEISKDALSLINRQKAEIERLTEEHKKVSAYIKGNGWGFVSFLEFVKNQRDEAIKEFAERLKEAAFIHESPFEANEDKFIKLVTTKDIDNLVKEMVGDGDE